MCAALQYAASFHCCLVEEWKDCEELKPKAGNRKWRVNKEMEGWMMRGSLELLPFVDDDDSDECSDE